MYKFVALDIVPPFTLTTHSQAVLSLSKMELTKPASTYKNELLHVVCGGNIESFLESVFSDLEVCHRPEVMNREETPLDNNEGTMNPIQFW